MLVLCLSVGALSAAHRPAGLSYRQTPAVKAAHTGISQRAVDCTQVQCLALTFDDGPNARFTPQVLDILARNNAPATFFLVGKEVAGREQLVQRMYREGHQIGNHSWNHANFTKITPQEIRQQIQSTQLAIAAAGVPAPHIFRPPYGAVDAAVRTHVQMPIIRWDIDAADWAMGDVSEVAGRVQYMAQAARPGSVILLHDTSEFTVQTLEPLIQALEPGYEFVTVSQLLAVSPGDQGQYFSR